MKKGVKSTNTVPIFIQNKTFPFADFFKEKKYEIVHGGIYKEKVIKEMLTLSLSFQPLRILPFP